MKTGLCKERNPTDNLRAGGGPLPTTACAETTVLPVQAGEAPSRDPDVARPSAWATFT